MSGGRLQGIEAGAGESRTLTGLRGLGALMVISHHLFLHFGQHIRLPAVEGLLRRGFLGVDLFFVLSGFIISMVYGSWFLPGVPHRIRRAATFLFRRLARLWPLHAAVLVAILAAGVHADGSVASTRMAVANFAMIQAWGVSREINPPAWSVSVELLAYLAFPVLAAPLLKRRAGPLLGLAAVVAMLGVCLVYAPPLGPGRRGILDIYYNYSVLPALRCLSGFILGVLAWRAGQEPALRRWFANPLLGPLALGLFLLLLLARTDGLLAYLLLPLAVLGFHFGDGPLHRLFAHGPLYWLGVVSYAVYLTHYTLLAVYPFGWAPGWVVLTTYLLVTLLVSTAAYLLIEVPGRAGVRRIGEELLAHLLPLPRRF